MDEKWSERGKSNESLDRCRGRHFDPIKSGAIYAWSAFTKKLTEEPYAFSKTQTQIIFAIGLVTFAVVMALVAGNWQKKVGPRKVAFTGGLVLGLGYIIAGLSGTSRLWRGRPDWPHHWREDGRTRGLGVGLYSRRDRLSGGLGAGNDAAAANRQVVIKA